MVELAMLFLTAVILGFCVHCFRQDEKIREQQAVIDFSSQLTMTAIKGQDVFEEQAEKAKDDYRDLVIRYAAYDSPFQKPFTNPRSGMGIRKV
jgi:hypothetical protein